MAIKILLGLGNPGARYRGTRHNLGFDWVDLLASRWKATFSPWQDLAERAVVERPEGEVWLAKPLTFMNLSGQAAAALAKKRGAKPNEVLVGFDDHALPLGQLRLRGKGSAGTHNGMKSVVEVLGTQEVPRLRLGCGPAPEGADWASFVLSRFKPEERASADAMVARACDAAEKALESGLELAMTAFNPKS